MMAIGRTISRMGRVHLQMIILMMAIGRMI